MRKRRVAPQSLAQEPHAGIARAAAPTQAKKSDKNRFRALQVSDLTATNAHTHTHLEEEEKLKCEMYAENLEIKKI